MRRRWRPSPGRLAQVVFGLTLFGIGEGLVVASELGNSPWSVFAEGIEVQTPLSIGAATFATSAVVLLCWIPLGERRLGLGTLLNALIIAVMIDVTLLAVPALEAVGWRWGAVLGGIALVGIGSGFYLTADLGPGPRDGLMTGIHAKTGWPIWAVRTGIESAAVAAGWVLGGTVGAGSLLFALLVGPAVATALRFSPKSEPDRSRAIPGMAGWSDRGGAMDGHNPSEQRGGTKPSDEEVREKGPWAEQAQEGVVPAELGGSDAPPEIQPDDPELGSAVLGRPAASDDPATETGIDPTAGDQADAVTDAGPDVPDDVEPDLKDATSGPREVDADSAA